jgi:hypothetical protein
MQSLLSLFGIYKYDPATDDGVIKFKEFKSRQPIVLLNYNILITVINYPKYIYNKPRYCEQAAIAIQAFLESSRVTYNPDDTCTIVSSCVTRNQTNKVTHIDYSSTHYWSTDVMQSAYN